MYQLLYRVYFHLRRIIRRNQNNGNLSCRTAWKLIGQIESYYNVFLKRQYEHNPRTESGVTEIKRQQRIIISLTSFPGRIDTVWLTVESLLQQSVKADEIILWLAEAQFNGRDSLPESLLRAENRGLTIRFCADLRSHKKYFYVMQEYPEDLIVLADDDAIYPKDMLKKLIQMHEKYPEDIIASTAVAVPVDYHIPPSGWSAPDMKQQIVHSYHAQPYTGCGTLYPPKAVSELAFDQKAISEICPYADDLWLYYMCMKNHTGVTAVYPYRDIPMMIYGTATNGLWQINGQGNKNDEQWFNILNEYGDVLPRGQ